MRDDNMSRPKGGSAFKVRRDDVQDRRSAVASTVADIANRTMDEGIVAKIGELSAAPRLYGDNQNMDVQIRSAALASMGGGQFRCKLPYGNLEGHAGSLAQDMITEACEFLDSQAVVIRLVQDARQVADRMLDLHESASAPAAVAAIGHYSAPGAQSRFITVMDMHVLGPALTRITERVFGADPDALARKLDVLLTEHARRSRLLAMLLASRSAGSIQETGRRVMAAVGMSLDFVLDELRQRSELVFDFDDSRQRGALAWDDGVLKCGLWPRDRSFTLDQDRLWFTPQLPHTLPGTLPGRRLGNLIDSAFIPEDAVITDAREHQGGEIAITLAIPTVSLPASCRPWITDLSPDTGG